MKKINSYKKMLIFSFGLFLIPILSSCGSTWDITGNTLNIQKAVVDTIVPKGTIYITPDNFNDFNLNSYE